MSVYSNIEIEEAIQRGHIIFHPYQPKHINGSSVDVTLGEWFYRTDRKSPSTIYNPFDKSEVDRYFGEPQKPSLTLNGASKPATLLLKTFPLITLSLS